MQTKNYEIDNSNMGFLKISSEEKSIQFIYLLSLWIVFSFLFTLICFQNNTTENIRGSRIVMEQISEKEVLLEEQQLNMKHIDSLRLLITQFSSDSRQSYIESSITYELNEIKKAYEKKGNDMSYKIYMQLNKFYSMLYFDKKATWNTSNNSNLLKKNLEECEIGFQQNQNNITLQEALQNNTIKE